MGLIGQVIAALCFGVAILGLTAGFFGGIWVGFDVLAHLRYHFAGLLLASIAAAAAQRYWLPVLTIGLVLTFVVIGLRGQMAGFTSPQALAPVQSERMVDVMTFNTWLDNEDWEPIAQYIRSEDPDVVVLQEVGPEKRPMLDELRQDYPFQVQCMEQPNCYLAILAKQPILDWAARSVWQGPPVIMARFGSAYGGLAVVGVHMTRIPYLESQMRQFGALANLARDVAEPFVLAGDFNATPWSWALTKFAERSELSLLDSWPTWPVFPVGLPQLPIDHILVSDRVRALITPRPGPRLSSDHLPVTVTLAVSVRP